jgi:hypothetical protein
MAFPRPPPNDNSLGVVTNNDSDGRRGVGSGLASYPSVYYLRVHIETKWRRRNCQSKVVYTLWIGYIPRPIQIGRLDAYLVTVDSDAALSVPPRLSAACFQACVSRFRSSSARVELH